VLDASGEVFGEVTRFNMLETLPRIDPIRKQSGLRWHSGLPPSMADTVVRWWCASHDKAEGVD
jgi:hypothetical protein